MGVSEASKRSLSYSCGCQGYRFHGFGNQLPASRLFIGGSSEQCFYRCHGGSHSSSTCMDTLDVLLQVNILVCAISSRPDLFVAVHDVSLMTPTQEGRLMAATTDMADVYLLWVERDGALLFCVKHRWQL